GLNGSTLNRHILGADTIQNTECTYRNPLDGFRGPVHLAMPVGQWTLESGYQYRMDMQDGRFIYSVKDTGETDFTTVPEFTGDVKAINRIHSVYTSIRARRIGFELGTNCTPAKWAQLYLGANMYHSRTTGVVLDYAEARE